MAPIFSQLREHAPWSQSYCLRGHTWIRTGMNNSGQYAAISRAWTRGWLAWKPEWVNLNAERIGWKTAWIAWRAE